jgi:hypothetical protein
MSDGRDERTLEQVYRSAVSGLYARLRSNYDFLYRRFGDDGIALIAEMSREYGLSVAARARERLSNADLDAVAGYLKRIFDTVGRGKNEGVIERGATGGPGVIIRVAECPLHFERTEMCRAHTTMERTLVEELNPALTYRIGKSIPAGDVFCEHILELKDNRNIS